MPDNNYPMSNAECDYVRSMQGIYADKLCEACLRTKDAIDLHQAFARFYLNRNLKKANALLKRAFNAVLEEAKLAPETADAKFKWQMRTWIRIYYLLAQKWPRLNSKNKARIEELFWHYACAKSTVARAELKYVWCIQGSENHDMMDLSNAFLALQAIKDLPEYHNRQLPDGHTPKTHCNAWQAYYKLYCDERAKWGLFVECASPIYGKYFVPELVNLCDFAQDETLRKKVEMLLHLTWADWAIEQLNGIRGGGKTRAYPGKYSERGTQDAYLLMSQPLINSGVWWETSISNHAIHGFPFILGTSNYRLPNVVLDLAKRPTTRGTYAYQSVRPAKMTYAKDRPPLEEGTWYDLDAEDSRFVRYTHCTPSYILGSIFVDPTLKDLLRVDKSTAKQAPKSYAAISSQNRWQGIVFATNPNARVFPQCEAEAHRDHRVNYNAQIAVQHERVMIVRKNRQNRQAGDMRVYFSDALKQRPAFVQGWYVVEEGDAYLAVCGFRPRDGEVCEATWDDDCYLHFKGAYTPVVFVAGDRTQFPTALHFINDVLNHTSAIKDGAFHYAFTDTQGKMATLTLPLKGTSLPQINNTPIDLAPAKVYDSPYLTSKRGSGLVTIKKGNRKLVLDFPNSRITKTHG